MVVNEMWQNRLGPKILISSKIGSGIFERLRFDDVFGHIHHSKEEKLPALLKLIRNVL